MGGSSKGQGTTRRHRARKRVFGSPADAIEDHLLLRDRQLVDPKAIHRPARIGVGAYVITYIIPVEWADVPNEVLSGAGAEVKLNGHLLAERPRERQPCSGRRYPEFEQKEGVSMKGWEPAGHSFKEVVQFFVGSNVRVEEGRDVLLKALHVSGPLVETLSIWPAATVRPPSVWWGGGRDIFADTGLDSSILFY